MHLYCTYVYIYKYTAHTYLNICIHTVYIFISVYGYMTCIYRSLTFYSVGVSLLRYFYMSICKEINLCIYIFSSVSLVLYWRLTLVVDTYMLHASTPQYIFQDFTALRKRLGGFGEAVKSFSLTDIFASGDDTEENVELKLIKRVKKVLNVFLVQVCFFLYFYFPR